MTDGELQQLFSLDAGPGPALAIDAAHADAIVEAALAGAGFGPGGSGPGSTTPGGGAAAGGVRTLAKGKLALLGGAVVLVVIAVIAWRATRGQPQELVVIPDAPLPDAGTGTGMANAADAHIDLAIEIEPTIEPTIEPGEPAHDAPARTPKPPRHHAQAETPDDLLGAANAKRAAKEWRASDELYARVVARAPDSLAAQTALVASASLHLEHLGDPKGAARRFSRALAMAPRGALAEDARWGLAEAARALHDTAAEKAALDDFLAHHATSPLASRAKARRAELP